MKPPTASTATNGRVMPACTMARGRQDALLRGRDGMTRIAPPPLKPRIVAPGLSPRPG